MLRSKHNPKWERKGKSHARWRLREERCHGASGSRCGFGFSESLQGPLLGPPVGKVMRESWKHRTPSSKDCSANQTLASWMEHGQGQWAALCSLLPSSRLSPSLRGRSEGNTAWAGSRAWRGESSLSARGQNKASASKNWSKLAHIFWPEIPKLVPRHQGSWRWPHQRLLISLTAPIWTGTCGVQLAPGCPFTIFQGALWPLPVVRLRPASHVFFLDLLSGFGGALPLVPFPETVHGRSTFWNLRCLKMYVSYRFTW